MYTRVPYLEGIVHVNGISNYPIYYIIYNSKNESTCKDIITTSLALSLFASLDKNDSTAVPSLYKNLLQYL